MGQLTYANLTVPPFARCSNCAYYDLADPRLTEVQRFILDGGVWGEQAAALVVHTERLATLDGLRRELAAAGGGSRL